MKTERQAVRYRIEIWRVILLSTALVSVCAPARASACLEAARHAELRSGLPSGLLGAIGKVESGAWNWSVNSNGLEPGRRFTGAEEAETYTRSLLGAGQRLIDLGCFQIDLLYHPDAFAQWRDAFDSERNATAAADILNRLHQRTGDWNQAIALYHSADPARGQPYLRSVLTAWKGGVFDPSDIAPVQVVDPYVLPLLPMRVVLAVWMPGGAGPQRTPARKGGGLPRIITP